MALWNTRTKPHKHYRNLSLDNINVYAYKRLRMKPKHKQRKCDARDCPIRFVPRVKSQRFHSPACKNKEAQRRYRQAHPTEEVTT